MSVSRPSLTGLIALLRGHPDLEVDTDSNKKLARVSVNGKPVFAVELAGGNIWRTSNAAAPSQFDIAHEVRVPGTTKDGAIASGNNPGMHSGLKAFFKTNELTCFHPKSLDEAWTLIEGCK